jgi:hypothetical protein
MENNFFKVVRTKSVDQLISEGLARWGTSAYSTDQVLHMYKGWEFSQSMRRVFGRTVTIKIEPYHFNEDVYRFYIDESTPVMYLYMADDIDKFIADIAVDNRKCKIDLSMFE